MPPKDLVTKEYLKKILRNEKELLPMNEIKPIKVPRYQELSVKALILQAQEDETLNQYLPDIDSKKKPLDREYFFNILNTIYPEYVEQLIEHAQNIRNAPELNEEKKEYILILDEWYNKLMSHPFISKKPGRTVQLLKESTKLLKGRKQKKLQDLGITLKRFKAQDNELSGVSQQINQQQPQIRSIFEDYDYSEQQSPQKDRRFNI